MYCIKSIIKPVYKTLAFFCRTTLKIIDHPYYGILTPLNGKEILQTIEYFDITCYQPNFIEGGLDGLILPDTNFTKI